jgi:hypothetical protein
LAIARAYAATATTTGDSSMITGCHAHGDDVFVFILYNFQRIYLTL